VVHIEGNRNSCSVLVGNLKGRDHLEDLDMERMILQDGKYAYNVILCSLEFLHSGTFSVGHNI